MKNRLISGLILNITFIVKIFHHVMSGDSIFKLISGLSENGEKKKLAKKVRIVN